MVTRDELLRRGRDRPERDPTLVRARRGVYVPAAEAIDDRLAKYLRRVRAAHLTLSGSHVFSHQSAAALLGVPLLTAWPDRVHLICERRSGGRSQLDIVRHCLGLDQVRSVLIEGMAVTDPARTAFDLAMTLPFEEAVVVVDAVLRLHPTAGAALAGLQEAHGAGQRHRRLASVLDFADSRSGSPGESVSRVRMDRLGFVKPELQVPVTTGNRVEYADFGWEQAGALGEFDGEIKYRLDRYRRGGSVEDVVIREKNRENRMRAHRSQFARWDWQDLQHGRLESILLAAGIPRRFD